MVGVKLVRLKDKLPIYAGESACLAKGGEMISSQSFIVEKISDCLEQAQGWWVSQYSGAGIFTRITKASIQEKFGEHTVKKCLKPKKTSPDIVPVRIKEEADPYIPLAIHCVFEL